MRSLGIVLLALAFISLQAHATDDRNLAVAQVNNAVSDKRIALVIGNSAYTNSPLKNPVNDAKDMANKLRGLGFDVIERSNLKTKQIGGTLSEFRSRLSSGAVALVFYAGHGLQINGENYLPAVDADINAEEDVQNQSLSVRQIMDVLDKAKTRLNLVFLDACRNNPYASRSFRSTERGLARVSAPSGTLISYATKPGSVAADGDGRNGLYTSKLLAQMGSNIQVELTLKRVVTEVKAASQGKQEPWMEGSIEGDFCFGGCQVASLEPVPTPTPSQTHVKSKEEIEQDSWDSVRGSESVAAIQEYLKQYPKGRFVGQAKILIANLKATPSKPVGPVTPTTREDGEDSLWAEVLKGNSADDYNAYLAQYPKGKYAGLAQVRIRKLQTDLAARQEQELWQKTQATEDSKAVQAYLDKYPSGNYVAAAQEKLAAILKAEAEMKPGKVFRDCPDCPEMVVIPLGIFDTGPSNGAGAPIQGENNVGTFGSHFSEAIVEDYTNVKPAISSRRVTINRAFAMGKYEVTQTEWRAVMGSNPPELKFTNCGDTCPVENVSWNDTQEFIQKLNTKTGKQYRLPTEAEWEYACYGGSQTEYCGGNDLNSVGWYNVNSNSETHPVGRKQANGYGLYDMTGNVWEWMNDCKDGDCSERLIRGGSWGNNNRVNRMAFRDGENPTQRSHYGLFGFRLVITM